MVPVLSRLTVLCATFLLAIPVAAQNPGFTFDLTEVSAVVGTPAAAAVSLAASLSPSSAIVSGAGPTQTRPASVTAEAKAALSARKPYPGCTASQPVSSATATRAC